MYKHGENATHFPNLSGSELRKLFQNMVFLWPIFFCIGRESTILCLYEKIRVRENTYSGIFYAISAIIETEWFQI